MSDINVEREAQRMQNLKLLTVFCRWSFALVALIIAATWSKCDSCNAADGKYWKGKARGYQEASE